VCCKEGIPLIGDKAPEFKAQITKGVVNFPKDYEGKWVVLFSHPADLGLLSSESLIKLKKQQYR